MRSVTLFLSVSILFFSCISPVENSVDEEIALAKGWFYAGDMPKSYLMGIVNDGNNKVGTIKSIEDSIEGFGALKQSCTTEEFAGKTIKMTAKIKTKDVKNSAGMWLGVFDANPQTNALTFDNMQDRPIKGNTEWKTYEIILDVPNNASKMVYGVLMNGTGQIWVDDFTFDIIGELEKTDEVFEKLPYSNKPTNLNFEEVALQ